MRLTAAREILLQNLPDVILTPQFAEDWTGPFPLPQEVMTYYADVGPVDLEIWAYGNPWYLPALAQLWDLQAGYRYHPDTNEHFAEWKDNWLVVAYEGGDPFIFDSDTGTVLHDLHGQDVWNPRPLFQDLGEMISVFAVLGGISRWAGQHITDHRGIDPEHLQKASLSLTAILGSEQRTTSVLQRLGWE